MGRFKLAFIGAVSAGLAACSPFDDGAETKLQYIFNEIDAYPLLSNNKSSVAQWVKPESECGFVFKTWKNVFVQLNKPPAGMSGTYTGAGLIQQGILIDCNDLEKAYQAALENEHEFFEVEKATGDISSLVQETREEIKQSLRDIVQSHEPYFVKICDMRDPYGGCIFPPP